MFHLSRYEGYPYEIGMAIGKEFGPAYLQTQDDLLNAMDSRNEDRKGLLTEKALDWFARLPRNYQEEFQGIAAALECRVEELLLTYVVEEDVEACTSFIVSINGIPWVGRNNDFYRAGRWNYVSVREIPGMYSTMMFGLPGDVFSGTGMNETGLWLHYNWLPAVGSADGAKQALEPFVFLRHALESCASIDEVESLIEQTWRTGGMYLFAVDGEGEYAALECSCTDHIRIRDSEIIVATNHYCHLPGTVRDSRTSTSHLRKRRVEELLEPPSELDMPGGLARILADPRVEQRDGSSATVYSLVTSPFTREIWFAADAIPAASKANWDKVPFFSRRD